MERLPTTDGEGRISRDTLTSRLEDALRADITHGVLRPGERIRAIDLTVRYGVSQTPLREALQRLSAENLIEVDPRLGATVTRISEFDLHDVYDVLRLLDATALERAIERGDAAWARDIDTAFGALAAATAQQESVTAETPDEDRRRIDQQASMAHWQFHAALYAACGSPWLLRFIRTIHQQAERYRMIALRGNSGFRRPSTHEHHGILQATRARDADAAVKALRDHLTLTVDLVVQVLKEDAER
jgi:GntR family transcriptional regulator, carbon starvation induced regulator